MNCGKLAIGVRSESMVIDVTSGGGRESGPEEGGDVLRCPLCEYDLRGLAEPRCPECGHRFEWGELTDLERRELGWSFETLPTPGRYGGTQVRSLWPWRFWRAMRPAQTLRPRRLGAYLLVGVAVVVLGVAMMLGAAGIAAAGPMRTWRARALAPGAAWNMGLTVAQAAAREGVSTGEFIDRFYPAPYSLRYWLYMARFEMPPGVMLGAQLLMLPVATGLVLGIMSQSFQKAKIRRGHLLRVAVYAADPLVGGLVLLLAGGWSLWAQLMDQRSGFLLTSGLVSDLKPLQVLLVLVAGCWLWSLVRLGVGVRRYLGMPRAVLVAMGTGVISFLAAMVALMPIMG